MGRMNNASYIESRFVSHMMEALNAEITLGNITSLSEGVQWMSYTFLAIRIRRNPLIYQSDRNKSADVFIYEQVEKAIKDLDQRRLVRYDEKTGFINSTELGRISSHFYIRCETMYTFCKEFGIIIELDESKRKKFLEDEIKDLALMKIVAHSNEFDTIKVRDDEISELRKVIANAWVFDEELNSKKPKGPLDKNVDDQDSIEDFEKVLALISGYLSRYEFETFSLVIDCQYVIQNTIRILRCILDIALKKNMSMLVEATLRWCRFIENRISPFDLPLRHFTRECFLGSLNNMKNRKEIRSGFLDTWIVERLEEVKRGGMQLNMEDFYEMQDDELANYLSARNGTGRLVKEYINCFPKLKIEKFVKQIAQTILKIEVKIIPEYVFSPKWHANSEPFLIIVDDEIEILHSESILISKKNVLQKTPIEASFFVPYKQVDNGMYRLTVISENWVDCAFYEPIELKTIAINEDQMEYTRLLDINPLPTKCLNEPNFEQLYPFKFFNPIQSQVFHPLYHTEENVLIGAPTGSGKTIMAELAIFRVWKHHEGTKVVYVAPLKALAKERIKDWSVRFEKKLNHKILELTGDYTPDLEALMKADVLITTPEKWDGISRNWQHRAYVQNVTLVVFDEIHLLGQDRGPVIEVIVSRMNYISSKTKKKIRMVGLSTAMANGSDVANWFGVKKYYFFNFKPQVRPVPITIYFDGFSEKHYCPRMATMNKPAYNAIKKYSDSKPVLIFVSSRRQTRLTALDLIALCHVEVQANTFLRMSHKELDEICELIRDTNLKQCLSFGIGMHHAGLVTEDRKIVEDLFVNNKIQVLIATSTLAWGVNFPARLVIIKGTEFYDAKKKRYVDFPVTDLLQMIGRAGRPQFDDRGIALVLTEQSKKNFYRKYLNDPFPIESSLVDQLHDHFNAEISAGTLNDKQACVDYLSWTYFFRRLIRNPTYYNVIVEKAEDGSSPKELSKFLVKLVDESIKRLEEHKCLRMIDEFNFEPTFLGQLASFYYIKHESISFFAQKMTDHHSVVSLIDLLSNSKEFEEVPVRHNEDNLNDGLADLCPYPIDKKKLECPHVKTFLLLQAHFSRVPLPIRDYLTDTKLVIDSSIRIIHCLADLAADKGYLKTLLNISACMQMVIQGVWIDDSGLRNIPHFSNKLIEELYSKHGITYLCQLAEFHRKGKFIPLLKSDSHSSYSVEEINEMAESIEYLPNINMYAFIDAFDSQKMEIIKKGENENVELKQGGEAVITVNLKRENHNFPLRVRLQKGSKIKDASWWLVVGNEAENKVLAHKKIYFKEKLKKQLQICLPENFEASPKLNVYLLSDSYIGLDQIFTIKLRK